MREPNEILSEGLGHPEGPYALPDGRVVFANTYASEIGVWEPVAARAPTPTRAAGRTPACSAPTDYVYLTQCPTVGAWVAPESRPPSIQRAAPGRYGRGRRDGGRRHDAERAERPHLRARRPAVLHRLGRLGSGQQAAPRLHLRRRPRRQPHMSSRSSHPSIRTGSSPSPTGRSCGSSPTRAASSRRSPDGSIDVDPRARRRGISPTGFKIDVEGNFWITTVDLRRRRRGRARRHATSTSSRPAACPSTACSAAPRSIVCDFGVVDTGDAINMFGRLLKVDVGVERACPSTAARSPEGGQMRIESIEAIPVSYPEPNDFDALRHLCLCKITADDGQVGWGESITQFPEANFATKARDRGHGARASSARTRSTPRRSGARTRTRRGGTGTAAGSRPTRSRRSTSRSGT